MTHFSIFNPDRWRSAFLDRKIAAPIRDKPDVNTSERRLGGVELVNHANRGDEP
jgi:hypothetical protein